MDWTIKSQTNDPDLALAIVADQRNKGYNAWIEDENGKAVDEEALKENKFVPAKPALRERAKGLLFLWGLPWPRSVPFICLDCGSITTKRLHFYRAFGRLATAHHFPPRVARAE